MRNVLVTGASRGIGETCALRMAAHGWRVFAGVRDPADGERLRAAGGVGIVPLRIDVTNAEDIAAAASTVDKATGADGLHGLVNNAGMVAAGPLEFLPIAEFRRQLEVNVVGQVAVTQALLPLLRHARGRVVFIGSISGIFALPFSGAYAASKFALEAVADALRAELRSFGMYVSIVEPGVIATPIWNTSLERSEQVLQDAPPELETYYGSALKALRKRVQQGMGGLAPERVAHAVEHALTAQRPRTRYIVGRDARVRALLKKLLPDRARDALIAKAIERL
jgi:NAD(P)-dependent dehydrogenase (short-subunit alcohol dehydrogenase family)